MGNDVSIVLTHTSLSLDVPGMLLHLSLEIFYICLLPGSITVPNASILGATAQQNRKRSWKALSSSFFETFSHCFHFPEKESRATLSSSASLTGSKAHTALYLKGRAVRAHSCQTVWPDISLCSLICKEAFCIILSLYQCLSRIMFMCEMAVSYILTWIRCKEVTLFCLKFRQMARFEIV